MSINPPAAARWAVVTDAGFDSEHVYSWHRDFVDACQASEKLRPDGNGVDVMRVIHATPTDAARLTTEY